MDIGRLFKRIQKNQPMGFSLIEVMVALAVLSVGLLAIFKLQITSTGTNTVSRAVTESSIIAAAKAEELLALPYDHQDLLNGFHEPELDEDGIDNDMNTFVDETGEKGSMTLQWEVVDGCLGNLEFNGHKCVHLRVAHNVNNKRTVQTRLDFIKTSM